MSAINVVTDFIKDAGLFTLLHLLVTAILVVAGIGLFLFARTRKAMWWFLGIGILPGLSGILIMYIKNRLLDTGMGLFAPLSVEAIAAGRREARIDLVVGVVGTMLILSLRAWRLRLNKSK
jgi:hypothetical protein